MRESFARLSAFSAVIAALAAILMVVPAAASSTGTANCFIVASNGFNGFSGYAPGGPITSQHFGTYSTPVPITSQPDPADCTISYNGGPPVTLASVNYTGGPQIDVEVKNTDSGPQYFVFTLSAAFSALGSASAASNSLHAAMNLSTSDYPMEYVYTDANGNTQGLVNPFWGAEDVGVGVGTEAPITVLNRSGGPVTLRVSLALAGSVGTSYCNASGYVHPSATYFDHTLEPNFPFAAEIAADFSFVSADGLQTNELSVYQDACGADNPFGGDRTFATEDVTFPSGTMTNVQMLGGASAGLGWGTFATGTGTGTPTIFFQASDASANAADTETFYIDVLTPGAYYTGPSGAVDPFATPSSPVPEPWTLALFGAAFVGLGVFRRRIRR